MNAATTWLSCGVLRGELEELHRSRRIGGSLLFLDSMLHMRPQTLEAILTAALKQSVTKGERLVLVYGDCCGRMLDLVRQFQVGRVNAINCAQMLLGRARYHELMHAQSFILLPEWALRWEEIMQRELGLSPTLARDFMRENRKELVYLDTGLVPVPHADLEGCATYSGLPWRVEAVTLDHLLDLMLEAEAAVTVPPPGDKPS